MATKVFLNGNRPSSGLHSRATARHRAGHSDHSIQPKTLQKFARASQIQGIHTGKSWRFRMSALEAWLYRQTGASCHLSR